MRDAILQRLADRSPTASVIVSISAMLLLGFLMTRLTKLLRLPNVTAYLITGILMGPYCLHLIPESVSNGMDFIADLAVAFIAFSVGEFFRFSTLRKSGLRALLLAAVEILTVTGLCFPVLFYLLRLPLPMCVVLTALAVVTSPSSTVVTIRQTRARGEYVDTLLQSSALDDLAGVAAFGAAVSVSAAYLSGTGLKLSVMAGPILQNLAMLLLGGFCGLFMKLLMPRRRSTDNRLIISISVLLAFCGVCALLDASPLMGCMAMGTVYRNLTDDEKLFRQLNYFSPPVLLLFFVRSGLRFDLGTLGGHGAEGFSLLAVSAAYFALRSVGKYAGAWLGCAAAGKRHTVRNTLGLGLMPQAGVSIGLAALAARTMGGTVGEQLQTVIITAGLMFEITGPALAQLGLRLSGAVPSSLEELTEVSEIGPGGVPLTPVELLTARLKQIQSTLPKREAYSPSEEENAFNEASEEQYEPTRSLWHRAFHNRR